MIVIMNFWVANFVSLMIKRKNWTPALCQLGDMIKKLNFQKPLKVNYTIIRFTGEFKTEKSTGREYSSDILKTLLLGTYLICTPMYCEGL